VTYAVALMSFFSFSWKTLPFLYQLLLNDIFQENYSMGNFLLLKNCLCEKNVGYSIFCW